LDTYSDEVPFYLVPHRVMLVDDHVELIEEIRKPLAETMPVVVVIDTLNRSITGSESSDEDMTKYIQAADKIYQAFGCAVLIVHHCGIEGTRPRGHTSPTSRTPSRTRAGYMKLRAAGLSPPDEKEMI
jgi:RecA-family ATPase